MNEPQTLIKLTKSTLYPNTLPKRMEHLYFDLDFNTLYKAFSCDYKSMHIDTKHVHWETIMINWLHIIKFIKRDFLLHFHHFKHLYMHTKTTNSISKKQIKQ